MKLFKLARNVLANAQSAILLAIVVDVLKDIIMKMESVLNVQRIVKNVWVEVIARNVRIIIHGCKARKLVFIIFVKRELILTWLKGLALNAQQIVWLALQLTPVHNVRTVISGILKLNSVNNAVKDVIIVLQAIIAMNAFLVFF